MGKRGNVWKKLQISLQKFAWMLNSHNPVQTAVKAGFVVLMLKCTINDKMTTGKQQKQTTKRHKNIYTKRY